MAKQIPLPKIVDLPQVVVFHRNHPVEQQLLLHIPTGPETGETYIIRLDQPKPPTGEYDPLRDHKGWVKRLPNSQALMDLLAYEMHVAYYPHKGGTVIALDDPDEVSWLRVAFALAREGRGSNSFDHYFTKRRVQLRGPMMPPRLRRALGRRPGVSAW